MSNRNKELNGIYENYQKNISTYLTEVTKTTSSYIQAVSDLQMEIIESWRNAIDSAFVLQENFDNKSRTKDNFPDMTVKRVMDVLTEQINKTQERQNKMLLASIDVISQNTKSFNDNIKAFDEFRSKIIQYFISPPMLTKADPATIKKAISEFKKTESIDIKEISQS